MSKQRGQVLALNPDDGDGGARSVVATAHPSAVLRAPDGERDRAYAELVKDLRTAAGGPRRNPRHPRQPSRDAGGAALLAGVIGKVLWWGRRSRRSPVIAKV